MKDLICPFLATICLLSKVNGKGSSTSPIRVFTDIEQINDKSNPGSVFLKAKHIFDEVLNADEGPDVPLIASLPNQGDVLVNYKRSNTIEDDRENYGPFQFWKGTVDTSEMDIEHPLAMNKATFILSPEGKLTCNIKFDRRLFTCKPCDGLFEAKNEASCVVVREEEVDFENQLKSAPPLRKEDMKEKERISRGQEKLTNVFHRKHDEKSRRLADDVSVIRLWMILSEETYSDPENDLVYIYSYFDLVDEANEIYADNGIDVELYMDTISVIYFFEENGNMYDSLTFITNSNYIAEERDDFSADLVTFITSDVSHGSEYYSLAWQANPAEEDNDDIAFSVVDWQYLTTEFALLHGIGHNIGCSYELEETHVKMENDYAYGYVSDDCEWHTIMANGCGGDRIPYFSNPDFYLSEVSSYVGTDKADCARIHNEYKEIIANFR